MSNDTTNRLFGLGQTVITRHALDRLDMLDVMVALSRHARGDWGDVDAHDAAANDRALAQGERLFSVYKDRAGTRFYVITEWDRSATTVLLPSDY